METRERVRVISGSSLSSFIVVDHMETRERDEGARRGRPARETKEGRLGSEMGLRD
jgi:hypothetical protein